MYLFFFFFFFNDTATTEIYTLSLHDALPICPGLERGGEAQAAASGPGRAAGEGSRMAGEEGAEMAAVPGGVGLELAAAGAHRGVLDHGVGNEGGGEAGGAGAQHPVMVLAGRQALVEGSDALPGVAPDRQVEAAERPARVALGRPVGEQRGEDR